MEWIVLLVVVALAVYLIRGRAAGGGHSPAALEATRRVADEDVTRFGEELRRLDTDLLTEDLDEAARQDYQRALDSYETAKEALRQAARPEDVTHVTSALEDGRYAVACVRERAAGAPLPTRRPPCFFNPAHGPPPHDVEWAPPGGRPRTIPVCAADQDRLAQGAEPDVRTVPQGMGRVPYWQGGPAYSPWVSGYFGGYATSGLLPGFLLGSMLAGDWDDDWDGGFDGGGFDGGGWDGGDGDFGDGGGDFGD